MKAIKVKKLELLDVVIENRELHKVEAQEAYDAWKRKVTKTISDTLCLIEDDLYKDLVCIDLPPSHHLAEYDRAIAMLEWSEEDKVELGPAEFDSLIRNIWVWTDNFKLANSSYTGVRG